MRGKTLMLKTKQTSSIRWTNSLCTEGDLACEHGLDGAKN